MSETPRAIVIGAGFGGLTAARALRNVPVSVLMIDQFNYHTFQPLLYQVATAGLEPEEVAHAVRGIFHKQENFDFRLGKVVGVDFAARKVRLADGALVPYDFLVISAGAESTDFGIPGVREHAFFLKSLGEAVTLRNQLIGRFEALAANPSAIDSGAFHFVVVGGGPTGAPS